MGEPQTVTDYTNTIKRKNCTDKKLRSESSYASPEVITPLKQGGAI